MKKRPIYVLMTLFGVLFALSAQAQRTITGKVTNANNDEALPGVSIVVKGTTKGTITDVDGIYSLQVAEGSTTLTASSVGFTSKDAEIGASTTLDITLEEDSKNLNEVIVTAFGVSKEKKALTSSVTEVGSKELLESNQQNLVSALHGKVPGAFIVNSSGAPGAGASIILRGINSLDPSRNNQPLVVIDGMFMSNETVVGNVLPRAGTNASGNAEQFTNSNRLADLNMDDVASVSILKGAAASALYGQQGSNGVILITTKKGVSGQSKITFSTSATFEELAKFPEVQTQYTEGRFGRRRFNGDGSRLSFQDFGPLRTDGSTAINNFENFFVQGRRLDNSLSFSGGNDKFTYFTSLGYLKHDGVVPFTSFNRLAGRFSADYQAKDWLKLSASVSYANSQSQAPNGGDKSVFSALSYYSSTYDANDYILPNGGQKDYSLGVIDNPRWLAEFSTYKTNVDRYTMRWAADAKLTNWLSIRYQIGYDGYGEKRDRLTPANTDVGATVQGFIVDQNIKSRIITSDLVATITKKLTDDINLKVLVGNQVFESRSNSLTALGDSFVVPRFYNLQNTKNRFTSVGGSQRRLVGAFTDLSIDYKNWLFLTASARNDWSSTLPKANNSFFYPSVGVSVLFSEALKIPEKLLDYGKVRVSYAAVGKDAEPYQIGSYYGLADAPFGSALYTRQSTLVNDPNLKPERTSELELGAELRFFKNRLGFDFTYFDRKSTNLIQPLPVSNATGYARYLTNIGQIDNKGIELAVTTTPVKTKDFRWNLNFTYSQFSGDVVKITDSIQQFDAFDAGGYNSTAIVYRYKTGGKIGDLYGYAYKHHSSGALLIGADGFPTIDGTQYVKVGNAIPDFTATVTSAFEYKGFSLSGLFEWRSGGDIVDLSQRNSIRNGVTANTERRNEQVVFAGVTADGSANAKAVEIESESFYRNFDRYNGAAAVVLQDGSWLRLRTITLGYTVPNKRLQKSPFSSLSVRIAGNNIWLNTPYRGFDPEGNQFGSSSNVFGFTGLVTPPTRSVTVGLTASFK